MIFHLHFIFSCSKIINERPSKMPFRAEKTKEQYPRTISLSGGHVSEWQSRMRLFESFQRLYQAHGKTTNGLNATMFAVIMIAPLSQMRQMLEEIRHSGAEQHGGKNPVKLLLYAMYTAPEAVRSCMSLDHIHTLISSVPSPC